MYLTIFIGNLTHKELMAFLRFVTGSSLLSEKRMHVSFNSLTGIARRPISHTCSCELQLSTSYISYIEFSEEFYNVLRSSDAWEMHAILTSQKFISCACILSLIITSCISYVIYTTETVIVHLLYCHPSPLLYHYL